LAPAGRPFWSHADRKGRNVKAKTVLYRLLVIGLIATLFSLGSVSPASAASGGGCGRVSGIYGTYTPCISAVSYGWARPDFYLTFYSRHPACTIYLYAVRASDGVIKSRGKFTCPSGLVTNKRYAIPNFYATSGYYATYVYMAGLGGLDCGLGCRSPWLKLP